MTYEYKCVKCDTRFDVIKPVSDIDVNEFCESCGAPAERMFVPSRLHITGAKVTHAEFNPGLGQVVKNKRHREEICKRRGLIEIGNDFKSGESQQKHFDAERAEAKRKRWEAE